MSATPERPDESDADDPRLLRAAQEYLAALESGGKPDPGAFAARFPELARDLRPYLEALDLFHAAAPPASGRPTPEEPLAVEALGDFRIVREIGRGGMGVVYEAVQRSLGRRPLLSSSGPRGAIAASALHDELAGLMRAAAAPAVCFRKRSPTNGTLRPAGCGFGSSRAQRARPGDGHLFGVCPAGGPCGRQVGEAAAERVQQTEGRQAGV